MISNSRSVLDRGTDALIRATSADIARHGGVDVIIRRLRSVLQRRRRHDLAGLAVAALHHLQLHPRLLQGRALGRLADRLDRGVALSPTLSTGVRQERTGWPSRCTVQGAAQRLAATELGRGHAEHVAQHPQKRGVAVDVDFMRCAVDL